MRINLAILWFGIISLAYSQTYEAYPTSFINVERYVSNGTQYDQTSWSTELAFAYAGKQGSVAEANTYRMIYYWDISSIPSDATVTKCELYTAGTLTSNVSINVLNYYDIEFKQYPQAQTSVIAQTKWNNITNATTLHTQRITRGSSTFSGWLTFNSGSPFVTHVQSSISYDKVYLSIREKDEGNQGTDRNIHVVDFKIPPNTPTAHGLKLKITYTVPPPPTDVSITAQNNFIVTNGRIIVDDGEQTSPWPFTKTIGVNTKVKAKEQTDAEGYLRVWANTVPNQPSKWEKIVGGSRSDVNSAIEHTFTAAAGDNNATYEAGLRRRYDITRNDQTEFDGMQSAGVVSQVVEQNSETVTAPLTKTVNNRNYLFYQWSDGVTTNQRTVSNPTGNQTLTALYKAHFLTDQNTGFETNGSHKFIRTGDGTLHLVYSSRYDYVYKIFYETSSDNGATWQLRYSGTGNGDPAIAAVNNSRVVFIYPTWNGSGNIVAVCYDLSTNSVLSTSSVLYQGGVDSPIDVNIAITTNGKILVTWYNNYFDPEYYFLMGYYARYGTINTSGVMSWLSDYSYEGYGLTSSTASHAAIDVRLNDGDGLFHFAFEDDDGYGARQIYYCPLIYSGGVVQWYVYSPYVNCLSSSSGFENNTNPSFIALNGSESTRFNWLGEFEGYNMSVFKDPGYYRYWNFGYGVTSTSINKASNGYAIGWSNGYDHSYTNSSTLYELGSISSTGRYVQLGNSDYLSNMKAMGFNTASSPYVFNLSAPIGSMQKADAQANSVVRGRSGVISIQTKSDGEVNRDSTKTKKATSSFIQFIFTFDNVTVDGQSIKFIDIPDKVKPTDAASLNKYLITEPFAINDNSSLTYDVAFSTTHSDKAIEVLKQHRYVNFNVELIDATTQQVIGVLNSNSNSESQITKNQSSYLDIDCRGIKSKEVQLRLVVATNAEAQFAVTDKIVRLADVLRKGSVQRAKLSYQGSSVVTSYALEQNYPNPFNPSTTITYQVPKNGIVTLKVYDILGKEVATLVNEVKSVGRYSTTFDGAHLSSGTYVIRMNTGDFVKTMKVSLIK